MVSKKFGCIILFVITLVLLGIVLFIMLKSRIKSTSPSAHRPSPSTNRSSFDIYFAPAQTKNMDKNSTFNQCSISDATCSGSSCNRSNCIMGSGRDLTTNLQTELELIDKVTKACQADTSNKYKGQNIKNPYKIRYSVYNLLLDPAITRMIKAANAGVYVQVLIEASQTNPCLTYNTALQQFKQAGLKTPCWKFTGKPKDMCTGSSKNYNCDTPYNCSAVPSINAKCGGQLNKTGWTVGGTAGDPTKGQNSAFLNSPGGNALKSFQGPSQWGLHANGADMASYNFIPILSLSYEKSYAGIMHTKMRLFEWKENGKNYNAVVSGSLNPDGTALQNEETVFVIKNHPIYKDYDLVYQNVLNLTNKYTGKPFINKPAGRSSKTDLQLLFSKGNINGGPRIGDELNKLISETTDMVLIFVYTMRDYGGLVSAIQQAAKNGAFVAVLTDIDQMVGEVGFSAPDGTCLPAQINSIKLDSKYGSEVYVPVYTCKNINGQFTAFHHKNMVVGVDKMFVTTDSANWTGAAVGGTQKEPAGCNECKCCGSGDCAPSSRPPPHKSSTSQLKESYNGNGGQQEWGKGNASSEMANCDTTLFINSYKMDQNKTGLAFVDIFFYLLEKHWIFTISNISKITHSKPSSSLLEDITLSIEKANNPSLVQSSYGGNDYSPLYPGATLEKNRLTVPAAPCPPSSPPCPKNEVVPHIYKPSEIGEMMLKIPNLNKNTILKNKITALSNCNKLDKYGKCS